MEIIGPQLPPAVALLATAPQAMVDAWKTGQLLQATAVSGQQNGQALINIGGTQVLAQTTFPLQPGQPLQLEVTRLASQAVLTLLDAQGKPTPLTVNLAPPPALLPQWQSGQLLEAILLRTPERGQAQLNLAGTPLSVQLSAALPPTISVGQALKLQILEPGQLAALRILDTASRPRDTEQALRALLPRQAPLTPLLANLAAITQAARPGAPLATPPLPAPLLEAVTRLVEALPQASTVSSAEGLKQAVAQSGLFLEARLAQAITQPATAGQNTTNLPADFKSNLLGLLLSLLTLTRLPPGSSPLPSDHGQPFGQPLAPPLPHVPLQVQPRLQPGITAQMNQQQAMLELLRTVETGLSRLQLAQLGSSGVEEDGRRHWVVELPVRQEDHLDLFQLRIERDGRQHDAGKPPLWSVHLAFDLTTLGPLQVRVTLAGKAISTTFWAEHATTTALLNEHLTDLHQRLRDAGLTVSGLNALQGKAPAPDITRPPGLLDVQA